MTNRHATALTRRQSQHTASCASQSGDLRPAYGWSHSDRTIFTVVSLVCISLLIGFFGYRTRQLEHVQLSKIGHAQALVVILDFLAISFVFAASVLENGLGLSSTFSCQAAIMLCLVFYMGSKVVMYIFLVERAHALRGPYIPRKRDGIWLASMLFIACGFGSIAICSFIWPIAEFSDDGHCRIGLPYKVTIPLLAFDLFINVALTAVFIYLLYPILRFNNIIALPTDVANSFVKGIWKMFESRKPIDVTNVHSTSSRRSHKSIEKLLWRSFIGSILVMLPTIGNLAALIGLKGRELGWVCLSICMCDGNMLPFSYPLIPNTRVNIDPILRDQHITTAGYIEGYSHGRPRGCNGQKPVCRFQRFSYGRAIAVLIRATPGQILSSLSDSYLSYMGSLRDALAHGAIGRKWPKAKLGDTFDFSSTNPYCKKYVAAIDALLVKLVRLFMSCEHYECLQWVRTNVA